MNLSTVARLCLLSVLSSISLTCASKLAEPLIRLRRDVPFNQPIPGEFSCEFIVGNDTDIDRVRLARKGDRLRVDFYSIDKERRTTVQNLADPNTVSLLDSYTNSVWKRPWKKVFQFVIQEGNVRRYIGTDGEQDRDIVLVDLDTSTGFVNKLEFPMRRGRMEQGSFIEYRYEVRDLAFEVHDEVFDNADIQINEPRDP